MACVGSSVSENIGVGCVGCSLTLAATGECDFKVAFLFAGWLLF